MFVQGQQVKIIDTNETVTVEIIGRRGYLAVNARHDGGLRRIYHESEVTVS